MNDIGKLWRAVNGLDDRVNGIMERLAALEEPAQQDCSKDCLKQWSSLVATVHGLMTWRSDVDQHLEGLESTEVAKPAPSAEAGEEQFQRAVLDILREHIDCGACPAFTDKHAPCYNAGLGQSANEACRATLTELLFGHTNETVNVCDEVNQLRADTNRLRVYRDEAREQRDDFKRQRDDFKRQRDLTRDTLTLANAESNKAQALADAAIAELAKASCGDCGRRLGVWPCALTKGAENCYARIRAALEKQIAEKKEVT